MREDSKRDFITASEISQYAYCPIAWYLERCGSTPESPDIERGKYEHNVAGKRLMRIQSQENSLRLVRLLEYLMLIGALLAFGWLLRSYI